jgi:hypothetical protein
MQSVPERIHEHLSRYKWGPWLTSLWNEITQSDGPHVMKRNAGQKVVNPQWQPFEFLRRDLRHRAPLRCVTLLILDYGPQLRTRWSGVMIEEELNVTAP